MDHQERVERVALMVLLEQQVHQLVQVQVEPQVQMDHLELVLQVDQVQQLVQQVHQELQQHLVLLLHTMELQEQHKLYL
jgi:hypothetical protein